jgi:hypothetical protein
MAPPTEEDSPPLGRVELTASAPAYRPGAAVTALLACPPPPRGLALAELEVSFVGVERVDTSWVAATYRRGEAPLNADRRRVQRRVCAARLQAAAQGGAGGAGAPRRFLVRFELPPWLPPTFRGTAVRYSYTLEATAAYAAADSAADAGAPPARAASARLEVTVWPARAAEGGGAAAAAAAEAAAAEAPDGEFPPPDDEVAAITCWEVGAGTSVADAVAHIARLGAGEGAPASLTEAPAALGGGRGRALVRAASSAGLLAAEASSRAASPESGGGARPGGAARAPAPPPRAPPAQLVGVPAAGGAGAARSFALRLGDRALARLALHPPLEGALAPGATLSGALDFGADPAAAGALRVLHFAVALETEEAVAARWRPRAPAAPLRRVLAEHAEAVADLAAAHFVLTLPRDAPPAFAAPLVALRWALRFRFVAADPARGGRLEELEWALPLEVVARG